MKTQTEKIEEVKIKNKTRKVLRGTVVSDKMDKTIIVAVNRFFKHPKYKKYMKTIKRYKVHDEENKYKKGDNVEIEEIKPISKDKTFKVMSRL